MKKRIIHILAGKGPKECAWVVTQLKSSFTKAIEKNNLKLLKEDAVYDKPGELITSINFTIEGEVNTLNNFVESWVGTIQWIGTSIFRKNHKRKNWFVKITEHSLNELPLFSFKQNELLIETMRASGNGGQNVNKLETAISLTHKPTGLVVISKDERSQHRNKQIALKRLENKLGWLETEEANKQTKNLWQNHNSLERGNAKRIFKGLKFKEQKTKLE